MAKYQKIFFSYSRADGEKYALQLATDLRNNGCNVWIDQLDIRPGKPWDIEIEKALENATCVLFVVTNKSATSKNTLDEVYYAIDNDKEVIPVIFENCQIPFRLKRLQHIDFTKDYASPLQRLTEALNTGSNTEVIEQKNDKQSIPGQEVPEPFNNKVYIPEESAVEIKPAGKQNRFIIIAAIIFILIATAVFIVFNKVDKTTNKNVTTVPDTTVIIKHDTQFIAEQQTKTGNKANDKAADQPAHTGKKPDAAKITDEPPVATIPNVQTPDTNYYRLQLKSGGNFIDVVQCGSNVILRGISGFDNGSCQLWRLVPAQDGWYGLQVKNGGKYLVADNCNTDVAMIPSDQFDINDACQLWRFVSNGDGWNRLQSQFSKYYLDAYQCSAKLVLSAGSDFDDGACQLWKFVH